MRSVLMSLLEINSNKLRLFQENQGTLALTEALTERKKMCLAHGLVEKPCVDSIRDIFSLLPVIVEKAENISSSVSLKFTPPSPSYTPSFDFSCAPSAIPLARTSTKTPCLTQIPLSRGQKKLSSFFLSQGHSRN